MSPLNPAHSKAQHRAAQKCNPPRTKQRTTKYVPVRVYNNMCVRAFMLRPVDFRRAWSPWHLQVGCLNIKLRTTYLLHRSVIPVDSSVQASVEGETARYAKRLVINYRNHVTCMYRYDFSFYRFRTQVSFDNDISISRSITIYRYRNRFSFAN